MALPSTSMVEGSLPSARGFTETLSFCDGFTRLQSRLSSVDVALSLLSRVHVMNVQNVLNATAMSWRKCQWPWQLKRHISPINQTNVKCSILHFSPPTIVPFTDVFLSRCQRKGCANKCQLVNFPAITPCPCSVGLTGPRTCHAHRWSAAARALCFDNRLVTDIA